MPQLLLIKLINRILRGMRWSRCLVYLDDVISFGTDASEALMRPGGSVGTFIFI